MEDHKRQQALDNFRNALGRLEQSDFKIRYEQGDIGITIHIYAIEFDPPAYDNLPNISNYTLRLKSLK